MNPFTVFIVIICYFIVIIIISRIIGKKSDSASFFNANKKSPWFLVAFGMIGTSLSGVTFISVPGWVGNTNMHYYQMVMGFLFGYIIIALVLLPIYYKNNHISIYKYLDNRFGKTAFKTGSSLFLFSRIIGASFRLFLIASVLQLFFFAQFGIPFYATVLITLILIWLYTYKAGIKTIVWTDTLQTLFLLAAVIITIIIVANQLNLSFSELIPTIKKQSMSQIFNWDITSEQFFFRQFIVGIFMPIAMTGLDQDMMQKNLTCRSLKDAKKNIYWYGSSFLIVNILFLGLGVLLYYFVDYNGITFTGESVFSFDVIKNRFINTDSLYPLLALNHLGTFAGIVFILGVTAAAFSSADSALTSLTTIFCVDFLNLDIEKDNKKNRRTKYLVHLGMSLIIFLVIIIFDIVNNKNVISSIYIAAGYTYGPLLGLYSFGLFTKRHVKDKIIPFIVILTPIITYLLKLLIENTTNFKIGFDIIIINSLLAFSILWILSKKEKNKLI